MCAVRDAICQVPFGAGFLSAELKKEKERPVSELTPEDVDPYTLYAGNMPKNVSVRRVEEVFHTAARVDIGFATRVKQTRYAWLKYASVQEAIEGFRHACSEVVGGRTLNIRFRRSRDSPPERGAGAGQASDGQEGEEGTEFGDGVHVKTEPSATADDGVDEAFGAAGEIGAAMATTTTAAMQTATNAAAPVSVKTEPHFEDDEDFFDGT